MSHPAPLPVRHNETEQRFEIEVGGDIAHVDYVPFRHGILFTHTEVPKAFEGQGIGAALARGALEYARSEGLRVRSHCPFMSAYLERHPEYQDLQAKESSNPAS